MKWKERFKRFRERYSAENLLTLLIGLVQNLMDSVLGSGNIFLQILILPILGLLLILVRLLRGLKWLISNSFELIVDAVNFIISLIARYFSEISFYWRLLATVSVWTNLVFRYLIGKMSEALNFQLQQLVNDQATLTTKYTKGYGEISLELIKRLFSWLWTLILAVVMSVGVLILVLLPVSVFVRKRYEQAQFYQGDFYTQFYSQPIPSLAEEILSPLEGQRSTPKRYVSTVIFLVLISSIVSGYYVYSWYYPSATYLSERGNLKFSEGKYAEALPFYNKALAVKSGFQEVLAKRKEVFEKLGMRVFQDPLKDGSLAPLMVIIPKGSFNMGSNEYNGEKPIHLVTINYDFALGLYEVTFDDYDKFCEATKRDKPSDSGWGRGQRPVINVNWDDATAYAQWLSEQTGKQYRLPSEAEWEYAARAGTQTVYSFGDDEAQLGEYAWYDKNSGNKTHSVGEKKPNPWGLYDMHGNVWEWCEDVWHSDYNGAPTDGSAWITGGEQQYRLLRGGSWGNPSHYCRSAYRYLSGNWGSSGGFRLSSFSLGF